MTGGEGGISGYLIHKISLQIVVESSNGGSNALDTNKYRSFILLGAASTRIHAHHECVRSSTTPMGLFFRGIKHPRSPLLMPPSVVCTAYPGETLEHTGDSW